MPSDNRQANHYVSCTGDYDCAADEHIEGCGIVDKRAPLEQQHDPHDAAERDLVEYIRKHRAVLSTSVISVGIDGGLGGGRRLRWNDDLTHVERRYVDGRPHYRIPLDS